MRDHAALVAFIEARTGMPFAWGTNDCVTFAAGAVEAMTGQPVELPAPGWRSRHGARQALARMGGIRAAIAALGFRPVAPAMARRGDIAMIRRSNAVAIVEGDTIVSTGPSGLVRLPRSMMVAAWDAER